MEPQAPIFVTKIVVKGLFGLYDYTLGESAHDDEAGRIILLYGDNGSGKTTILRTLFHLLSPNPDLGHKSKIAETPFQRFDVWLSNGVRVTAHREPDCLMGSFTLDFVQDQETRSFLFKASDDLAIRTSDQTEPEHNAVAQGLETLASLNLALYYLADDRTLDVAGRAAPADEPSDFEALDESAVRSSRHRVERSGRVAYGHHGQLPANALLQQSVERFGSFIRTRVLEARSAGELSVNALYNEIMARLAALPADELKKPVSTERFRKRAREIETRSRALAQYDFLPEFTSTELLKQLMGSESSEKTRVMAQVLSPYLESWERRLEALQSLYGVVNNFMTLINGFFSRKELRFNLSEGLSIVTDAGKELALDKLSSGERHLLLLFCNTVAALHHPSIFIIDEPEISLNIKWQRSLIDALCECIGTSPIQYVFATHSLEIISRHRDRVLKLKSTR